MTAQQRIAAFQKLGQSLDNPAESFENLVYLASQKNRWFTGASIRQAVRNISQLLLHSDYTVWLKPHGESIEAETEQNVGLVLAGNIPLVGFHDVFCSLIAGFSVQIKTSSDDEVLIRFLMNELVRIEPAFAKEISFVSRLERFDLVIATGSNNTSRYFEHYFGKVPHIIRKNRNSVAVVSLGDEEQALSELGSDIFSYFGLGCRNVSKLFLPEHFPIERFFEAIEAFKGVADNSKYFNNYEYNKALFLVNAQKHFDNGFLLLTESSRIASPLAVCHFEYYQDISEVEDMLNKHSEEIQCISTNTALKGVSIPQVAFGHAQTPGVADYADNVDTIDFLLKHKTRPAFS